MNILVFCDDPWHPGSVIKKGLSFLKHEDYSFEWVYDAGKWSSHNLSSYSMVILAKTNNKSSTNKNSWMTIEIEHLFKDYVQNGGSFLVLHSGCAGYEKSLTLRALMGGVFSHHPEQCKVNSIPLRDHSLTKGCESFELKDEHYFITMDDNNPDIFMTTESEHGAQPGAWRRTEGKGKIAVFIPGHNLEVWMNASFQKLLGNIFDWLN